MIRSFFLLSCLFSSLAGHSASWEPQSEEEALFLRRIADFWREGEYEIVKNQIEEFLEEDPDHSLTELLRASLGDLYLRDNAHKAALMQYARIKTPELQHRVFLNRMQCLLELQWFATLAEECETQLLEEQLDPSHASRATYLLFIALYQQCLQSESDKEKITPFAEKALGLLDQLQNNDLFTDIAKASAHLYTLIEQYEGAARIYFSLAEKQDKDWEEMLFQAALFQAQYDPKSAKETFQTIREKGVTKQKDAAYNELILAYDCGLHEELIEKKEFFLQSIPKERQNEARFLFAQIYLKNQNDLAAIEELLTYTKEPADLALQKNAWLDLLAASYRTENLTILKNSLQRFHELYPNDPELPKGYLSLALLYKKKNAIDDSRSLLEKIRSHYPQSEEFKTALLQQLQLEFEQTRWQECRLLCQDYLGRYKTSSEAHRVWSFLTSSSLQIAQRGEMPCDELLADIQAFFDQSNAFQEEERCDWTFVLAKTHFDLQQFDEATHLLENLLDTNISFSQKSNAKLLLAFCYRDGFGQIEPFCEQAGEALKEGASFLEPSSVHIALFNGYLEQEDPTLTEKAAEHLYLASQTITVEPGNLLWLADFYYEKAEEHPLFTQRAIESIEKFSLAIGIEREQLDKESLLFEPLFVRLAELYKKEGRLEQAFDLLLCLQKQQKQHPTWIWQERDRVDLLLAKHYEEVGSDELALLQYKEIATRHPTARTYAGAYSLFKTCLLQIAKAQEDVFDLQSKEMQTVLSQLKTLVLQKTWSNEPIHLQAALEYIDLQVKNQQANEAAQKELSLLLYTKENFEKTDDILSKDYHAARKIDPEKDALYQTYLTYICAQIDALQGHLTTDPEEKTKLFLNARTIYEKIVAEKPTDFLVKRAQIQLERFSQ